MGAARGLVPRDQVRRGRFQRVELKPFGIDVIVIEPGAIRTEWGQIALDNLQQTSGHTVYAPQAEEKRALFLAAADSASDPDVVPREIIKAVQASRPKYPLRCRRPCQTIPNHGDLLPRPLRR